MEQGFRVTRKYVKWTTGATFAWHWHPNSTTRLFSVFHGTAFDNVDRQFPYRSCSVVANASSTILSPAGAVFGHVDGAVFGHVDGLDAECAIEWFESDSDGGLPPVALGIEDTSVLRHRPHRTPWTDDHDEDYHQEVSLLVEQISWRRSRVLHKRLDGSEPEEDTEVGVLDEATVRRNTSALHRWDDR